jgi:hypothetical protein
MSSSRREDEAQVFDSRREPELGERGREALADGALGDPEICSDALVRSPRLEEPDHSPLDWVEATRGIVPRPAQKQISPALAIDVIDDSPASFDELRPQSKRVGVELGPRPTPAHLARADLEEIVQSGVFGKSMHGC